MCFDVSVGGKITRLYLRISKIRTREDVLIAIMGCVAQKKEILRETRREFQKNGIALITLGNKSV